MSLGRVSGRSLFILLCVVMLSALLPAAALAAPEAKPREYIVTLDVVGSDNVITPSSRSARQRIDRRSERAKTVTNRLAQEHGFKTGHRYGNAITGFSAKLTPEQAAEIARDEKVANVRPARKYKLAAEVVPFGITRVKAVQSGGPRPDVNANVAVMDTGIGPGDSKGDPVAMGPTGNPELNIVGGINCFDDPWTPNQNEAALHPGRWADTHWHGTHVAGTIGARDNNVGTIGVAPGARLWAVRIFQGSRGSEGALLCGLDWAVATHSSPAPDIDVINLSIQGPRLDDEEDCGVILADPGADPVHKGVCAATQIGITVVAAAGNQKSDANNSSPGGYDQVISVGAKTDYDGLGWGAAGNNGCAPGERDDTYATSYSNYGRDVDIVAPGTCVLSTYPSTSGAATTTSSGTSMAAPHVTGAVARYLADHPNTTPDKMRKLVRASGRMDWDAKTDPVWSGVSDLDEPNRVLDVKALTGAPMLKSWVYYDSFKVAGTSKSRTTRVDVQRGGGFKDTADLDVTGLPGEVGTATFDRASLSSLVGLGTNLHLDLKTSGPDGAYGLGVKVNGSGVSPFSRDLDLTVDRTGPVIADLAARIRGGNVAVTASGAAQTYMLWDASDTLSGVKSVKLQRRIGDGAWRDAGTRGTASSRVTLKRGQNNKFRVKATDGLGNKSTSKVVEARLTVRDSKSTQVLKPASGGWRTKAATKAYGGSLLLASNTTDSLVTSFYGKAVAVVGAIGPKRGSFRVRIDGGDWHTVSLKSAKAGHRRVVWSRRLEAGPHELEIQGLNGHTAIDAVLIIR